MTPWNALSGRPLSTGAKTTLNIILPSLYLLPAAVISLLPKNSGFGHPRVAHLGLAAGALGIMLWILAMIHLGKSFAVLPGAPRLIVRGVYKYLRHPMYYGIMLTLLGMILAAGSVFGVFYFVLVILPLNYARSRLEEEALLRQFGEDYQRYRNATWF